MVQVQAPAGASLEYTGAGRADRPKRSSWATRTSWRCSRSWGSASAAPRRTPGIMFVRLKEFDDRDGAEHSLQAVLGRLSGPLFGDSGRDHRRLPAAGDPRARAASADSSSRCSTRPAPTSPTSRRRPRRWRRRAISRRSCAGCSRPFTANDPQLQVTIDRAARARARPAAQRDHQRDADLPRVAVRERLRVQQPRLPRLRAGGPAISARTRRRCEQLYARTRERRDGPARAGGRRRGGRPRRRSSATSTCSARRRSTARRRRA